MADKRTDKEIESRAIQLHAIQALSGEIIGGAAERQAWENLHPDSREGWIRLAEAIRGVVHYEDATSGGWPTASQADTIRKLRDHYTKNEGCVETSWIGETRPYGEMVVIWEWPQSRGVHRDSDYIRRGFLIHPDGYYEELHRERVPDSYIKKEG